MSSSSDASLTAVYKCPQGSAGHAKQQAVMQHAADSHISHLGMSVVLIQQDVLGLRVWRMLSIAIILLEHERTTVCNAVCPNLEIMVYDLQMNDKG